MKSEVFVSAVLLRRLIVLSVMLWVVAPNSSFFTLPFSSLYAQGVQTGKASYYSKRWTGRRTANGDRLHHDSLTCAHRTYPFGTLLQVTNPANGRVVVVRVNDRGPFVRGRIVDLSWGAARELGILAQGIAQVRVEPLVELRIPMQIPTAVELPKVCEALETSEFPWRSINGVPLQ